MSSLIPFDQIVVGDELGPIEAVISERAVENYCNDWDDPNPWYLDSAGGSPFGTRIVPPAFLAGLTGFQLLATKFNTRATIGVRTEHLNLRPLPVGQKMVTKGRIAGKYIKRGLEYVVVESTSYDGNGESFRKSVDHVLLSLEKVAEDERN